jgi:exopolysaccharide biosynthesis polyprenyl glycosylphosphotransferase
MISDGLLPAGPAPPAVLVGSASVVLTLVCLGAARAWDAGVLGQGSEELSRVVRGLTFCAVAIGLSGLAMKAMLVRPWVFGFVPLAAMLVLAGRYALRKSLHRHRDRGECMRPMLAVGTVEAVAELIGRTRRDRHNGWTINAVCTPTGTGPDGSSEVLGVPVVGDLDSVVAVVESQHLRAVSVSATPGWGPNRMRQLAWDLEEFGADLVVDPGIMEVAGPRLHITPIDGLPLLRLTKPTFTGVPRIAKYVIDRIGAALLLALLAPVMIGIAIAVKCDGGPVFFQQTRVGRHGESFRMIKFRSMVVDAEQRRALLAANNEGSGPLFKIRKDPRVTRIGAVLRKYSLDELPQLFNVVGGSMSLVGPRPPLPAEVKTYSADASRKLLVRPGLTGLWQVSGRSDLSWEESVRIDLRYVENWTLAQDVLILWKTFGAIIRGNGAY